MNDRVSFECRACHARLKAAVRLAGRHGHCPACGETVVVPMCTPEEAGPMLVLDDGGGQGRRDIPRSWY
jgi:hypothetical protein